MANLPISGLPNLTVATNNSLIPIVVSGVTYNINILDLWKSPQPFATMYQDWIPDAPSAHTIGSIAYPLKSIFVSTGSVFIGPNNSLAIDNSGVLYSTNVFAAPTFQVGNVTSGGGIVSTSGVTFSVVNNEMLMISNSGGTITNLTQQTVPTGGTINQIFTQTGNTNYAFGWVTPTRFVSTGGTVSQVLTKTGDTSSSFGWVTPTQLVPTGGTTNQVLTNNGSGYVWSGLTTSQIPTRYYGAFSSTVTQVASGANAINTMSANTTEHSYGVTLSANTRFVMSNAGVYNIQFSAQLQQQQNVNSDISIWFRKNGVNITNSNTEIAIEKNGAGNSKLVAAWNYVDTFNANDYFEIVWSSPDGTMELLYQGTQTGPVRPATPSLIVTVTQV